MAAVGATVRLSTMKNAWMGHLIAIVALSVMVLSRVLAKEPATAPVATSGGEIRDALDKDPAPPWEWVRHQPAGVRVKDGALELKALSGTLWGKPNNAPNQLVRPSPLPAGEPLVVQVTVNFAPEAQAEQAGLMLYFDDANYVKVVREWLGGKRFLVMGVEKNEDGKAIAKVEEPSDTVTLRMTCRGEQVVADYRTGDGAAWKEIGKCELPATSGPLKLGICAYGGPGEQARWARFSSFVVSRAASQ